MLSQTQEYHLDCLVINGGFDFTDTFHPYTSGEIGSYFVQSAAVMKNGAHYTAAIEDMASLIKRIRGVEPDTVSGGETRDWIFSNLVATTLGLASTMIYKDGTMIGASVKGKNIIHVADLNNEGSSIRDMWVPYIRNAGGIIGNVVFYIDRCESDLNLFRDLGVESHSLISLNADAWDYLVNQGVVSKKAYSNIRERMEDKGKWARAMLRSPEGVDRLEELAKRSEKDMKKVRKVLDVGYSDLKEELISRLNSRGLSLVA